MISWDLHFTARLPIFGSQGKTRSFLNFDRPIVRSWSWKVSANYFVWLIPSRAPNRRKKTNKTFISLNKEPLQKENAIFQPCFFSEMLVFGGVSKLFNCSISLDTWTEVTRYMAKPQNMSFNMTSPFEFFGGIILEMQPKLKSYPTLNLTAKKPRKKIQRLEDDSFWEQIGPNFFWKKNAGC